MKCPACQYVNPTMSARCMQCRTTLEHEGVGHSDLYRQGMRETDIRILSGIGAIVGGLLGALIASMSYGESLQELAWSQIRLFVLGGAAAGGLAGRAVAWRKNRWL